MNPMTDGLPEEILRLYPPTTRARGLARRKADAEMDAQYPEMHIAYIDEWNGDEVMRTVVVAHPNAGPFHDALEALPPEVRARVQLTSNHTHDLFAPRFELPRDEPEPGVQ